MFGIGLIIGIILGAIVTWFSITSWVFKIYGISKKEAENIGILMIEAAENRECELTLMKNDQVIDSVLLEE